MSSDPAENLHQSVLLDQALEFLRPQKGGIFVDATLGLGGHAWSILAASDQTRVIGIDQDREAIGHAEKRLARFGERVAVRQANFSGIKDVIAAADGAAAGEIDGILADLGVSSLQFDSPERGFSFRFDAPLDMRMDAGDESLETAAELLARLPETEIARIIYEYGEERFSRRIARRIVRQRERGEPVVTTGQLAALVEKAVIRGGRRPRIHPATKTFQALRIAVNRELEILEGFIRDSVDVLKTGGRLVLITFHSLEDRIVKRTFRNLAGRCSCPPRLPVCVCGADRRIRILTPKPVVPDETEVEENPRARSAKLRAGEKLNSKD